MNDRIIQQDGHVFWIPNTDYSFNVWALCAAEFVLYVVSNDRMGCAYTINVQCDICKIQFVVM